MIAAILPGNAVLGFVQERHAERAVAALRKMAAAIARVVRDVAELKIPAEELVPGDTLVLGEGDAVGADGRILHSASLTIAEAPLTGGSEPAAVRCDRAVGRAPDPGRPRAESERGVRHRAAVRG